MVLQDPRGRVWSTVYMTYASRVRRAHVTGSLRERRSGDHFRIQ